MNYKLIIGNIAGWAFGLAVFIIGLLNVFRGNDQDFGVGLMLVSFIFYPPVDALVRRIVGFSVHYAFKIILAIFLIWVNLAVGALAEGYYVGVFD